MSHVPHLLLIPFVSVPILYPLLLTFEFWTQRKTSYKIRLDIAKRKKKQTRIHTSTNKENLCWDHIRWFGSFKKKLVTKWQSYYKLTHISKRSGVQTSIMTFNLTILTYIRLVDGIFLICLVICVLKFEK
jgi:hypothetical protein